jgi:ribonucleoside-diphosphate reductase alpha chain
VDVTKDLFEMYGFYAIKGSSRLAKERGSYPIFEGSDWSK